jgi:hypothetical protein
MIKFYHKIVKVSTDLLPNAQAEVAPAAAGVHCSNLLASAITVFNSQCCVTHPSDDDGLL